MKYKESLYWINGIRNWSGTDSEGLFNENLAKFDSETLEYYKKNPIVYRHNNYGFRTPDDFNDTDEGNVFLGCSHTMGVGHHLENTWSYKLNKDIGGKFWNLSQGGCGIQTDYRLLYGWKDTLKIKNIFHYTMAHPRFEFFRDDEFFRIGPWDLNPTLANDWPSNMNLGTNTRDSWVGKFYLDFLSDHEYCNYIQETYINAIKGLSQDIGCNYYYLTNKIFDEFDGENDNSIPARDLGHYSVGKQNYIYEEFKKLWAEYLYEKI